MSCLEGSRHLCHRTLFGAPKSLSQRLRCSGATWWQTAKCSSTSKPLRGALAGGLVDCPHFSSHLVIPWFILPKEVGVGQERKPLPLRLLCFSSYFHEKVNQAERGSYQARGIPKHSLHHSGPRWVLRIPAFSALGRVSPDLGYPRFPQHRGMWTSTWGCLLEDLEQGHPKGYRRK